METTKMTIHRGLAELKLIDSKIANQINEIIPVGLHQKGKKINDLVPEEDFKKTAQSKYDSINDLIARKNKIKSAIVKANCTTMVKVAGVDMTIADAITMKDMVKFKKDLVTILKQRQQQSVAQFNKGNEMVQKNMQAILEATFGKENVKVGDNDVDAVRKPYMEANEFHLFDPLKVNEKIEQLTKETMEFEADVDATLSECNAVTLIEI